MPPPIRRPLIPGIARPVIDVHVAPVSPVLVTPAGTRSLAELVDELRQLRASVNRAVHRSGVILRELSQPHRIAEARVVDFAALLETYDLGSPLAAAKYIAVADSFSEDQAAGLGVERGYAIVRAARALPRPIPPRQLLAQNPTIRFTGGAVRLAAASVRAVVEWAGSLRVAPTPAPSKQQYKAADSVRDKLHRRFASAGIDDPHMRVVRRASGYAVRMELSPDDAATLLRLVKAAKG